MAYKVETLINLANAGASVVVGNGYVPNSLVLIAQAMKGKPGHLTIKSTGLSPDGMLMIAQAAPGQVTFDTAGA